MKVALTVLVFVFLSLCFSASANKKVVCYWGTWAAYRHGKAKFTVDDIDPRICTHMVYSFFGAKEDGTWKSLDPYLDLTDNYGKGYISKFIKLKKVNPQIKMFASIGGWNMGGALFGRIASNPGLRSKFASSVLNLLQKFGFDGFDLDWEYPKSNEKGHFVEMLKELKKKLHPAGKLLTIAVGATEKRGHESYDIRNIVPQVDFINLMTYDLHGSWDGRTGINSPLYSNDKLSLHDCVRFWLSQGCPKDKLIVGMPTYGRSFTLANAGNHNIGAQASAGQSGRFIPGTNGFLPYNEICTDVKHNGWTRVFANTEKAPYAYKGNQWVGYDDPESIKLKLDYVVANQLGGAMFWSIETDDFGNICGGGKNPLITMAHNRLKISDNDDEDLIDNRDTIDGLKYDVIQNIDETITESDDEDLNESEEQEKDSNLIEILLNYQRN